MPVSLSWSESLFPGCKPAWPRLFTQAGKVSASSMQQIRHLEGLNLIYNMYIVIYNIYYIALKINVGYITCHVTFYQILHEWLGFTAALINITILEQHPCHTKRAPQECKCIRRLGRDIHQTCHRWHPVLCLCQLGQDIPYVTHKHNQISHGI